MVKVTFKTDGIEKEVDSGMSLMDVATLVGSSLAFGCGEGVCGSCLITVHEGLENLSAKSEQEEETLQSIGAKSNQRLACRCKVNGDVVIENSA
jgi:ferredoxin